MAKSVSPLHILVFSKTTPDAYRHDSIPAGIAALHRLAESSKASSAPLDVTASEDSGLFTKESLAQFQVIVFLNAGGDFLSVAQLNALKGFVAAGGGTVGIHAAIIGMPTRAGAKNANGMDIEPADAEGWYGRLLGAEFAQHPDPQWGEVAIHEPHHPTMREATRIVRARTGSGPTSTNTWRWFDEWYNFSVSPRLVLGQRLTVLLSVDETSYEGGTMGHDHAIAWCHQAGSHAGGRVFYTGLGHFDEAYQDAAFVAHIRDGILWTAGVLS